MCICTGSTTADGYQASHVNVNWKKTHKYGGCKWSESREYGWTDTTGDSGKYCCGLSAIPIHGQARVTRQHEHEGIIGAVQWDGWREFSSW